MALVGALHKLTVTVKPRDVVKEFIEGLVATYPGLAYLTGFPEAKVVLHVDATNISSVDKVAIISGGQSGHEPAHAGFVGKGMLTAAICGEISASPSVNSILAGIRAVTGPKECLLIVKSNAEDIKNFKVAAELAKAEKYTIEIVIVSDDLAGIILVHKVAGAAAAAGHDLVDVFAVATRACELVKTTGVESKPISTDGKSKGDVDDFQALNSTVSHAVRQISSQVKKESSVVLMVDGLGRVPVSELLIFVGKVVSLLKESGSIAVERVYMGSFTDMGGFSLSLMKVDGEILQFLDTPTDAPYWPKGVSGVPTQMKTVDCWLFVQELVNGKKQIFKAEYKAIVQSPDLKSKLEQFGYGFSPKNPLHLPKQLPFKMMYQFFKLYEKLDQNELLEMIKKIEDNNFIGMLATFMVKLKHPFGPQLAVEMLRRKELDPEHKKRYPTVPFASPAPQNVLLLEPASQHHAPKTVLNRLRKKLDKKEKDGYGTSGQNDPHEEPSEEPSELEKNQDVV